MSSSETHPSSEKISTGERLRAVATELFAERGFAGASMSDLARRIGIRKPSLYNYFSSKEELFIELLESSLDSWREASLEALEEAGSFEERLFGHLRKTVEFTIEHPHAMAICRMAVTQIVDAFGDRVRGRLLEERLEYQQRLEELFKAAVEVGEMVDVSPQVLALSWLTFLDGVLFHQLFAVADRSGIYLDHLDRLWWLFWRGVAAGRSEVAKP